MTVSEIAIAILERPQFDNTRLGDPWNWTTDNLRTLSEFWKQCGHALGLSEDDEEELTLWIRCQHDLELRERNRARLPHGASL